MTTKLKHPPKTTTTSNKELEERLERSGDWAEGAKSPEQGQPRFPWSLANPRITTAYNFRMSEELHMQLKFLVEHEPRTSIQKIIYEAVETEVEKRLKKYIGGQ